MIKLFDYIYYRLYLLYNKTGSFEELNVNALGGLSIMQALTIFNIYYIMHFFFLKEFPEAWQGIPLMIIILTVNYIRYDNRSLIEKFDKSWRKNINNSLHINLIILYLVVCMLTPITVATLALMFYKN